MAPEESFSKLKAYFRQLLPLMTEEGWNTTERVLSVRTFKKGEFIATEGSICNYVSFINYGFVRLYFVANGKEKIVNFSNENMYVSDYQSFLTRNPGTCNVQALEATEVVDISHADLQMLYRQVPDANIIGRMIAEKLFLLMCEMNRSEVKETILQRYHKLIAEQPWLLQRAPQYMIASYLGVTPEAFSRIKAKTMKRERVLVMG